MGGDGRESAGGRWGGRGCGGEGGSGALMLSGRTASVEGWACARVQSYRDSFRGGIPPLLVMHDQWGRFTSPHDHDYLASTTEDTMVTLGLVQ